MSRRRRLVLWISALAVLVAAGLLTTGRKPPRLPGDKDHALKQVEAHCLVCHSHMGKHVRPVNHPLRDDCFSCHRDAAGKLHPRPGAPTSLPGGWLEDPRLGGGRHFGGARPSPAEP